MKELDFNLNTINGGSILGDNKDDICAITLSLTIVSSTLIAYWWLTLASSGFYAGFCVED